MKIDNYKSVSNWYKTMKYEGYEIPLTLYHTLSKMVNENNISFQQAYLELEKRGKVKIVNKKFDFYLSDK